jgi:hypothetical protein
LLEPGFSRAGALKNDGYSEGTVGAVQTFFFPTEDGPWTMQRLAVLAPVDVVIRLSRERGRAKVYPTVDVSQSRSRLLELRAVEVKHTTIARTRTAGARVALGRAWRNPTTTDCCRNAHSRCKTI